MSWSWPHIEALFEQALVKKGIPQQEAAELTRAIAEDLAAEVAGDQPYIPKRSIDHKKVQELFNGRNHRELAKRYGVTPRTIRRWLDSR